MKLRPVYPDKIKDDLTASEIEMKVLEVRKHHVTNQLQHSRLAMIQPLMICSSGQFKQILKFCLAR